jgi:hypothetical protein
MKNKMSWHLYSLTFRLKSPLHIGSHKVMHLSRTRAYVPARPLWGALTSKLTCQLAMTDYEKMGEFLKKTMIFGYFYLSDGNEVFIPQYTKEGLKFGSLSQIEFEKRYISSLASTAIESNSFTAEEGTLHEVEFVSPYSINDGKPVFLRGLLWVSGFQGLGLSITFEDDDFSISYYNKRVKFSESLDALQLGGERKYGFGLLKIEGKPKKEDVKDLKNLGFFGEWEEKGSEILLKIKKGDPVWSHVEYTSDLKIRGDIEAIVGRDWDDMGAGRKLSTHGLCWSPGSVLIEEEAFKITHDFGLWIKENP